MLVRIFSRVTKYANVVRNGKVELVEMRLRVIALPQVKQDYSSPVRTFNLVELFRERNWIERRILLEDERVTYPFTLIARFEWNVFHFTNFFYLKREDWNQNIVCADGVQERLGQQRGVRVPFSFRQNQSVVC